MLKLSVLLGGFFLIVFALIGISMYQLRDSMMHERKDSLQRLVEAAHSITYTHYTRALIGELTMEEAKEKVRNNIRAMRYGQGGYLFVVDTDGIMQAHPVFPDLENKNQSNMTDLYGHRIIEGVQKLAKEGAGILIIISRSLPTPSTFILS